MTTRVHAVTVIPLADALLAARSVEHPATLVDDATHTVVVIDQRGRVTQCRRRPRRPLTV